MSTPTTAEKVRYPLIGLAALAAFVVLVRLALAAYGQEFTTVVPVTVKAERAGLLLDSGAAVKLRGAVVGHVQQVDSSGAGATVAVGLDPAQIGQVPAGVTAAIVPPTVFGSKYVELTDPAAGDAEPIRAGAVIDRTRTTVEINSTFQETMRALHALQPVQLNTMLNSVAGTLRGKGGQIGGLVRETNDYLHGLNPSMPALDADVRRLAPVADAYHALTPDLLRTVSNTGALSRTVVDQQAQLAGFLASLNRLGNTTAPFLQQNERALATTLEVLRPTLGLTEKYSPVIPCLFGGVVRNNDLLRAVMGGPDMGGTHRNANVTFTVGKSMPPYQYPRDLPKVGAATGPDCHGMPRVSTVRPYVNYDTGANPYAKPTEGADPGQVPLGVLLFGQQLPPAPSGRPR